MADSSSGDGARYVAFISYSHRDAALGRWLHRRLEGYRLPRRLAGSEGEHGPVPARLTPIFRDRDELPAAGDLSAKVRAALTVSDNLIVLCSPHAAASPWVAKEIATFRDLHPDRPVFAAIVEGDPAQCFPPELRAGGRIEPLAADLRKQGDGRRLGLLKLVAGLAGVGLDALAQRDAQRRIRRVMAVTVAAVIAMLVMAAATLIALNARAEAERQRVEAEGLIEFMLTDLRERLKGVGSTEIMIDVNRRALKYYGGQKALNGLSRDSLERRARILHVIGEDEKARGHLPLALRAFREAHRITGEQLARAPGNPERIFYHVQSEYWLASIDEERGDYPAALNAYQRYRAQAEHMNRLSPNNPRFLGELAYAESNLGSVHYSGFHRYAEARRHFQNSLRWFVRLTQLQPANRTWRVEAADAHAWIADTWYGEKRYREARAERLEEQRLKRQLLNEDPSNRAYLYAMVITTRALGRIDIDLREFDRALPLLEEARATMARLLALDPDNVTWRDQATKIETNRALLFAETGQLRESRAAIAAARTLLAGTAQRRAVPSEGRDTIRSRLDEIEAQLRATSFQ